MYAPPSLRQCEATGHCRQPCLSGTARSRAPSRPSADGPLPVQPVCGCQVRRLTALAERTVLFSRGVAGLNERKVLRYLLQRADQSGSLLVQESQRQIAEAVDVHQPTVSKALRRLREKGWLEPVRADRAGVSPQGQGVGGLRHRDPPLGPARARVAGRERTSQVLAGSGPAPPVSARHGSLALLRWSCDGSRAALSPTSAAASGGTPGVPEDARPRRQVRDA